MDIAITGIGSICADHVAPATILPTIHHEWLVGEVRLTNEELAQMIAPKPPRGDAYLTLTRNVLLGQIALQQALADAGIRTKDEGQRTIPLINGTTVGGMDITEQCTMHNAQCTISSQHEAAFTTRKLAELNGLKVGTTISTACSSALNAIIRGANLIRVGRYQQVVAGGCEAMTRFHLNGFASLGILSKQVCRPFQPDRDGINLGEGAAYLVLEDGEVARRRGVHIYGYIAGYGNRCDAYHQTASSPDGEGAYLAMQDALTMAGLQPSDITYINAHGTATPNNDASEMAAIEKLFKPTPTPSLKGREIFIESTKPITGHTTSASGAIEVITCLKKLPSLQGGDGGRLFVMNNAFGFGGNDSSIVLSAMPHEMKPTPNPSLNGRALIVEGSDDYKQYLPPMQARRLTPSLRRLCVAAYKAIEQFTNHKLQITNCTIDGIVVATRWGGMVPTMALLEQLRTQGEHDLSPAQFMQSTHNVAAGTLARLLGCKGYNNTLVTDNNLLETAIDDAQLAITNGMAHCVLACAWDEKDNIIAKATIVCSD